MKKIVIIASAVFLLTGMMIYACIAFFGGSHGRTAEIRVEGRLIRTVDLDNAPDETFTVDSDYGTNTVRIENGEISITEASCPDKICVKHGPLRSDFLPIICLPNKLEIILKQTRSPILR